MVTKLPRLPLFNTVGYAEKLNVIRSLRSPLSGYLGGKKSTGYFINKLEEEWADRFGVRHAIACNSATSGLYAACIAAKVKNQLTVTTALTMSATAAAPILAGSVLALGDIEPIRYSLDINKASAWGGVPRALIVANIFGHPAYLAKIRDLCDTNHIFMIEDNAQSPLAMEDGKYAGTIGDVGVFSLNVHKHIQCGEGGVMVTNRDEVAERLRHIINHGELAGGMIGLNLRMTETAAAIACAQLRKVEAIVNNRREIGMQLNEIFGRIPWLRTPVEDFGCRHSYYLWVACADNSRKAEWLVEKLKERGVPMNRTYSPPLGGIFARGSSPVAELLNNRMVTFEVCAYNPNSSHMKILRTIVEQIAEEASLSPSLLSSREGEREDA